MYKYLITNYLNTINTNYLKKDKANILPNYTHFFYFRFFTANKISYFLKKNINIVK